MQLPIQTGPQPASDILSEQNTLITSLNSYVGMFAPQTAPTGTASDTNTSVLQSIVIPANLFSSSGMLLLRGAGTVAANTHGKTLGISLVQGTTTVSMTGSGTIGTANWTAELRVVNRGTAATPVQSYWGQINMGTGGTDAASLYGSANSSMSLSLSSAITAQLTAKNGTAGASDTVATYFGGELLM